MYLKLNSLCIEIHNYVLITNNKFIYIYIYISAHHRLTTTSSLHSISDDDTGASDKEKQDNIKKRMKENTTRIINEINLKKEQESRKISKMKS